MTPPRRRPYRSVPLWVREMPLNSLHGLALHLRQRSMTDDLTGRQEWLWDVCIVELEYRRRTALGEGERACVCELCIGPFDA